LRDWRLHAGLFAGFEPALASRFFSEFPGVPEYRWTSAGSCIISFCTSIDQATPCGRRWANESRTINERQFMKQIRIVLGVVCASAVMFGASSAFADQSCCVKANATGKECTHKCCTTAHKETKTCETCQAKPTCCDKAIAKSEACAHECCAEAKKAGKVCEKCNPKKEEKTA
jgi:hypothetical protein